MGFDGNTISLGCRVIVITLVVPPIPVVINKTLSSATYPLPGLSIVMSDIDESDATVTFTVPLTPSSEGIELASGIK